MIVNYNVRTYRPVHRPVVMRQRPAAKTFLPATAELRRALAVMVVAALLVVLAASQLFSWQIGRVQLGMAQLEQQGRQLAEEQALLREQRDRLISARHIQAVAGARLGLFVPKKGQVHSM